MFKIYLIIIILYESNLDLTCGDQLFLQGIKQTIFFHSLVTDHHLQKHVLECAITYSPFKLNMFGLLQLPQPLENHRDAILTHTHFDQPSNFLNHSCRSKHAQQSVPNSPLHLKLLPRILLHDKLFFSYD